MITTVAIGAACFAAGMILGPWVWSKVKGLK